MRLDARGYRTTSAYSALDQLEGKVYPDGSRQTFVYDVRGNQPIMHDSTGRHTSTFDSMRRTSAVTTPANKTISYGYDDVGRRRFMVDPDNGRFTYSYDVTGRLAWLSNPEGDRTTFTYDVAGRRTVKRLANGTRASMTYDAANRLEALYHLKSNGTVIASYDYGYDNAGNRTDVLEASGDRVTYSYDNAYRLTNEHRSGVNSLNTTYVYDAVGNRTSMNTGAAITTTTYDAANQQQSSITGTDITTFTYDAAGNLAVTLTPTGDRTTNTWDYENQRTLVVLPDASRVTMSYNASNRRVSKETASATTKFVWEPSSDAYLFETDGSDVTQVVYTNEPTAYGRLISQRRSSATHVVHTDGLGSVRELTNSGETVSDTLLYDAWGNELARTGSTVIPFQYVGSLGYYFDTELGTNYIRARHYAPTVGRWLSVDPLGVYVDIGLYLMAASSPARAVDPSGFEWEYIGNNRYRATGFDSLKDLAKTITGDPKDYACIWIEETEHGPYREWKFTYPRGTCGAIADVSSLRKSVNASHQIEFRIRQQISEHPNPDAEPFDRRNWIDFLVNLQIFMRSGRPFNSGYKAASLIARKAKYGQNPLSLLVVGGHCSPGHKIGGSKFGFGAEDLLLALPPDLARLSPDDFHRNVYQSALKKQGPPRCWFSHKSNVFGLACRTGVTDFINRRNSWAKSFAIQVLRMNTFAHGTPTKIGIGPSGGIIKAEFHGKLPQYSSLEDILTSPHWVIQEGQI